MQIEATRGVGTKRRRTPALAPGSSLVTPAPAAPLPDAGGPRVLGKSAAKTWPRFEIGEVSTASGPWQVNWERAYADAQRVLDQIDFSKRDIVVWLPGTSNHGVHPAFRAAIDDSYKGQGSNAVALEYEAGWNLRQSVPTGIATMHLVLAGIRARGGDHRVLLAGESQGAWIAGEVMSDPTVGSIVDRAVLLGHPSLAKHQYADGQDPRVRVINHEGDLVAARVHGDVTVALDAMIAIHTLDVSKLGEVLKALASNPSHGVSLLGGLLHQVPLLGSLLRDPHVYDGEMTRAVEYLKFGTLPFSRAYLDVLALSPAFVPAAVAA
jgi:hypothetical protein